MVIGIRRRLPSWVRIAVLAIAGLSIAFIAVLATIYLHQHAMIYHPRPYDSTYRQSLPPQGVEIEYSIPAGKQTAFYVPGAGAMPKRLWLAFCGNASLALDWTTVLRGYPNNGDAFLLIDYPGYGKNAGYATIETTRVSAETALHVVMDRLQMDEERLPLCAIGHSLGSAAALDFAARHRMDRIVAIAAFTTLEEEAATVVGRPLSHLLIENYNNRSALTRIRQRNPAVRIAIFHGTADDVIPVRMGRELAREFPNVEFFPVNGADHVTVLTDAKEKIIAWMNDNAITKLSPKAAPLLLETSVFENRQFAQVRKILVH